MAGKNKQTRKFEKKHLSDTLKRRKEFAKVKQRIQVRDKKKARNAKYQAAEDEPQANGSAPKSVDTSKKAKDLAKDMTVDEFFQGGFTILEKNPKTAKGAKRKRDQTEESGEEDDEDDEDDEFGGLSSGSEAGDIPDEKDELGEFETHAKELETLKEKDPEFYKYLQENDPEVLGFGDDSDSGVKTGGGKGNAPKPLDEDSDIDDEDVALISSDEEVEEEDMGEMEVTSNKVNKWEKAMVQEKSLRSTREILLAFRAAVQASNDNTKGHKYAVSSPEVYHKLLLATLTHLPGVLEHHLPVQLTKAKKKRVATESKKFRSLSPLLKSHTSSIELLITTLSDEKSLNLALTHMTTLLPYIISFRKALKKIIKTVVDVWSDPSSNASTRITAFMVLEEVAVTSDPSLRETVLKNAYQGLIKGCRNTTPHTLEAINIMKNTCATLWGIDPTVGYTTGFALIRQLAVHLRSSIAQPTKESYKAVYNWQYIHSLDFWSRVLSRFCSTTQEALSGGPSQLRPLIYPLTQITLGAARLIPTPQYFPLRFHLIRSLDRLALATETYIPLAPLLLEILSSPALRKPSKPSTLKPLPLSTTLRAPQSYLKTRAFASCIGGETADLFAEVLHPWAKHIAFPELSLPISVSLSRWLKAAGKLNGGNRNVELNTRLRLVADKIAANAEWVKKKRAAIRFAPAMVQEARAFLEDAKLEDTPLGAFVRTLTRQRLDREKTLEESRKAEEASRKKWGGQGDDDDLDGVFEGSEDDDGGNMEIDEEEDEDEFEIVSE